MIVGGVSGIALQERIERREPGGNLGQEVIVQLDQIVLRGADGDRLQHATETLRNWVGRQPYQYARVCLFEPRYQRLLDPAPALAAKRKTRNRDRVARPCGWGLGECFSAAKRYRTTKCQG